MINKLTIVLGDWLIRAGVRLKWRGPNHVALTPTPPAPLVVTGKKIAVRQLGLATGKVVVVRVVRPRKIEVRYEP